LKALIWAAVVLGVVFVGLQFIRPALDNPPVTADLQVPPDVKQILRTSCYNCHSNETKLPWFDRIVPAYWIAAKDVREGRQHLNFCIIGSLPAGQQKAALYESVSQIELGAMPIPAYKRVHPESVITQEQLAVLKKYLTPAGPSQPATPTDIDAAAAEYEKWIQTSAAKPVVAQEPNGFTFLSDYKNWKAISSSERFDNGTVRQILGNDVAIKAIAENHIDPWPDGTVFAKVTWWQQADEKGEVRPGKFFQVEFMLRDSQKYATTLGWGWGRWRGTDLKPYGKDAEFAKECVGCHSPLRNTNYVFTMPIRGQQ